MSVFVQATDGRFYKRPIIMGVDFYVLFDEADDPEVVVRRFKHSTPESGKTRASKVLREAGMKIANLRYQARHERRFPPDWKVLDAYSYNFMLRGPIPIPDKHDHVVNEPGAVWDHTLYGFWSDVPTEDVVACVVGGDISPMIARALLAQAIYKTDQERVRAEICKKLYAQYPWLRGIKKQNVQEVLKAHTKEIRIIWRAASKDSSPSMDESTD